MLKRMLQSHTVKYRGPRDREKAVDDDNNKEEIKNSKNDRQKDSREEVRTRTCRKRESTSNGCCSVVVTDSAAESAITNNDTIQKIDTDKNNKRKIGNRNTNKYSIHRGSNVKENVPNQEDGHRLEPESIIRNTCAQSSEVPVFVLGGIPKEKVPRNVARFDAREYKKIRRRFVPSVHAGNPGFNHYDDGAGFMDGEDMFGDDADDLPFYNNYNGGGLSWEGMGTTSYHQ